MEYEGERVLTTDDACTDVSPRDTTQQPAARTAPARPCVGRAFNAAQSHALYARDIHHFGQNVPALWSRPMPFFFATIAMLVVLIAFPEISLVRPRLIFGGTR